MPISSSTNLTDLVGVKIPNEWMRGGEIAFVDSTTIYSGGTNDLVLIGHTTARIYVYTSQDKGVTWTALSLVASDPLYPLNAPNSVCLTSDGKVHCVSGSFEYTRINLVRSGGHVTGYSWDTATVITIPTVSDSGYYVHYFPSIKRVTNGLGAESLFVTMSSTAAEDTDTLRIGACVTTNITPAAATDFRSLSGTASTATQIWATTRAADGCSGYETWAETIQHPTSSVNYLFFGQGANETTWNNAPLGYYPITPDSGASTWTVGTQVIVGRGGTSGPGWHLWGTDSDASYIYFAYDPAATGPKIGRIDGSGNLTASYLTIETLSVNAMGTFGCDSDGTSTRFFACYCTNWNASPRTSKRAYYEGGSWTRIDDDGTFDTNAWLPGHSKVSHCGTLHGFVAILNQDNNQTNAKADYWISTLWMGVDASVSCTQSPPEPQQTGASPFQNLNYVAATQAPGQPRQIASAIEAAVPTWVATGTFGNGTISAAFPLPSGIVKGDILLALCESANQAVTVSDAAGGTWTEVTNSPQGTGTAGGTSATRITSFWSRYNGTQTQPTFACTGGNHVNGCIVAIRGCVPEGNPIHVSTGGVKATSSTATSITGSTTTKPNCLIVAAVARMDDSSAVHYSAWTNASLTSVTEIADGGGVGGNGGGIGACCGGLASAGTYNTTTATNATTTTNGFMTFAFLGVESGTAVVASASESPEQPSSSTALTQLSSSSVSGTQATAQPSQTGALQVPNAVTGQQTTAAATQTGTLVGSSSIVATESTAAPSESTSLAQTATVSGAQSTVAPSQIEAVLQPTVVSGTNAPTQPIESATLAWQAVAGTQSTTAPTETEIVFQGANVATAQSPSAPSETDTLSQFAVAGSQLPATALESATLTQPSTVAGTQSTAQPSETAAALQTNSVAAIEATAEPRELGQAAQAAAVSGAEATTQPNQVAAVVQGARVTGTAVPTQPFVTAAITQPSTVLGLQQTSQPVGLATLGQTSSVVGSQTVPQPDEATLLQQGSLVAGYQALEEPDQTGRVSQQYSVTGVQITASPTEVLQLFATSRVDSACVTFAPQQTSTIVTYQPATVAAFQSPSAPNEMCHITPAVTLVRIRVSEIRSRASMFVTLRDGEI
jgi:hypothetical protein